MRGKCLASKTLTWYFHPNLLPSDNFWKWFLSCEKKGTKYHCGKDYGVFGISIVVCDTYIPNHGKCWECWDLQHVFLTNQRVEFPIWSTLCKEVVTMQQLLRLMLLLYNTHGLRTPNEAFFHWNPNFWAWAEIGQINFGALWVFSAKLSASILIQWVLLSMFSIIQPLFLQKTKPF